MRHVLLLLILTLSLAFFQSCSAPGNKHEASDSTNTNVLFPYSPRQDINFEAGNELRSKKVLEIWKAFEAGNLLPQKSSFADSLTLVSPDTTLSDQAINGLNYLQKKRSRFTTVQCHIQFWKSVKEQQRDEDWVLVWAQVESTLPSGMRGSYATQQLWKFNRAGKINFLQEFNSRFWWQ